MITSPATQASAMIVCPGCAVGVGGLQVYSGVSTGNYREAAAGGVNILLGAIGLRSGSSLEASFSSGGTKLVSSEMLETYPGSMTYGSPMETFISPTSQIDQLLAQGLSREQIATTLGITDARFLKGNLIRIDVNVAILKNLNLRSATGQEIGANGAFVAGGQTTGGITEGVVNGIPVSGSGVSTKIIPNK